MTLYSGMANPEWFFLLRAGLPCRGGIRMGDIFLCIYTFGQPAQKFIEPSASVGLELILLCRWWAASGTVLTES